MLPPWANRGAQRRHKRPRLRSPAAMHQEMPPAMSNRLAKETSPYLLQHKDNPVDWYPWGEEALAKAKAENKPIFLSIGYAACHWCHVMEHESFEDQQIADVLNEHFVPIKVDREERPDLDQLYMNALQVYFQMIGSPQGGGWPLSMFLTPDLQPFLGGTYWPPRAMYQRPGFLDVLNTVARFWRENREQIDQQAARVTEYLVMSDPSQPGRQAPVPAPDRPATAAAAPPAVPRSGPAADGHAYARQDGGRRHLRPARRRLPSLCGR
jgi:uncharacterized protein YyaL (SSP411 family)